MLLIGKMMNKRWTAFSLVEALISLLVVSLVTLSFGWLFRLEAKINQNQRQSEIINWHLFLNQLEYSIDKWEYQGITSASRKVNLLDHSDNGQPFEILFLKNAEDQRGVLIKRKRNGYEPILTHVNTARFLKVDNHVRLEVEMEGGNHYEADIHQWRD